MNNILIKQESAAARCEVCHQEDYFDQQRNYCARCETGEAAKILTQVQNSPVQHSTKLAYLKNSELTIGQKWTATLKPLAKFIAITAAISAIVRPPTESFFPVLAALIITGFFLFGWVIVISSLSIGWFQRHTQPAKNT